MCMHSFLLAVHVDMMSKGGSVRIYFPRVGDDVGNVRESTSPLKWGDPRFQHLSFIIPSSGLSKVLLKEVRGAF